MPHTYECLMRWADMDMLGHINNVKYLEYVRAARERMFGGLPAGRARVARHDVEFAAPLSFRRAPVLVDSWVTDLDDHGFGLAHEVYDGDGPERTVYLRTSSRVNHRLTDEEHAVAETLRGPAPAARRTRQSRERPRNDTGGWYDIVVRRSDLDERGAVSDVQFFELLQESRIRYVMDLHTKGEEWRHHVIATTQIDYLVPMPIREEAYVARSWIGDLGTKSFTVETEVIDGETTMARASVVMVGFDVETQRSAPMTPAQRARLEQELTRQEAPASA